MKHLSWTNGLLLGAVLLAALAGAAATLNAGESPKTVRIIYTNDTVGYAEPCG